MTNLLRREHQQEWEQIRQNQWQLWKSLCRDRDFVLETARLRYNLTLHYRKDPKILGPFFDGGYLVSPSDYKKELQKISGITDKNLRTTLERYLRYSIRFQVYMLLPGSPRKLRRLCPFRVGMLRSGSMFQARVEDGRLVPIGPYDPEEPASEAFATDSISVPDALKRMIAPPAPPTRLNPPENIADTIVDIGRDGKKRRKRTRPRIARGKFLLVEDNNPTSLLRSLLELSYSPETITVVQVTGDEIPYFFCVIGENVPIDSVWRQAGVAVKQMQIQLYKRERAGRPVKLTTLKSGMNLLLRGSRFAPLKSKAESHSPKWLSAVKQRLQVN